MSVPAEPAQASLDSLFELILQQRHELPPWLFDDPRHVVKQRFVSGNQCASGGQNQHLVIREWNDAVFLETAGQVNHRQVPIKMTNGQPIVG